MRTGGIVLCGGRSSRMGQPKAWLPLGTELMLPRIVRIVRAVVDPVVVVAARGQDVPPLPAEVEIIRDEAEGCGPLGGLAAGLAALSGKCEAVYLSSCDVPLLKPEFVRRVVAVLKGPAPCREGEEGIEGSEELFASPLASFSPSLQGAGPAPAGRGSCFLAAVPHLAGRLHPLASAYRVSVLPQVREMLAANRLRLMDLFNAIPTRFIGADELADIDPTFASLQNINTPEEYDSVLHELTHSRPG